MNIQKLFRAVWSSILTGLGTGRSLFNGLKSITIILIVFAMPAAAQTSANVGDVGTTPGRLWATLYAVGALASVIAGGMARRSPSRTGSGRRSAMVALILGIASVVLSAQHLARATGDFGTGSGRAGAIVALVLGVAGIVLGWLNRARVRREGGEY